MSALLAWLQHKPVTVPAPRTEERRSVSPTIMRCCEGIGWHRVGCSWLDQQDAGERRS